MFDSRRIRQWTLDYSGNGPDESTFDGVIAWQASMSAERYLQLYIGVGEKWNWLDRRLMPPEQLDNLLSQKNRFVGLLKWEQKTVGYTEVFFPRDNEVQICYFGLLPELTGRGLGAGFLNQILQYAWSQTTTGRRIWLTTCEWDSPQALSFYQRHGFVVVRDEVVSQSVPHDFEG